MSETVKQEDLQKALSALQDIAKGHSSRGTATTAVETMSGVGGSTQVYHTPSNSEPGSWAGSSPKDVPENGASDNVASDGTDYQSQGKMMKSIIEKLAKGQPLSADEASFYSVIAKGGNPFAKKDGKDIEPDDDKDDKKAKKSKDADEDDEKMGKSLADFAAEDETVSKGLEVSEFLAGFASVMHKSLASMEERVVSRVLGALAHESEGTGEFNKSLAEAVGRLGEAVTAVTQRVDQVESQPAHAPRAAQNVQALEKGGYGGPQGEPMSKALVAATLVDLVQRGEATPQDVLKFDSSNTLSARMEQKVRAAITGSR